MAPLFKPPCEGRRRRRHERTTLQLFYLLLWVVGLVTGLSGVYLLLKYSQASVSFSNPYIIIPGVLSVATAAVLSVSGCVGLWLSIKDSIFLEGLSVYFLVVVFCLQSTAAALAHFHSMKFESETAPLGGLFQNYTGDARDPLSRAVDALQEKFQCCGFHDFRDWFDTPWFNSTGGDRVPQSCCTSTSFYCSGSVEQPWQLNTQGCQVALDWSFQFVLSCIAWSFPVVFLLEVFVLVTLVPLMKERPLSEYHILD